MSSFEICDLEPFVPEVTPQPGSLEEAASTQEILIAQLENYLERFRAAVCTDLTNLPTGGATSAVINERIFEIIHDNVADNVALSLVNQTYQYSTIRKNVGGVFSWDAVNHELTINETGVFLVYQHTVVNTSGSNNRIVSFLEWDRGGGFAFEAGGATAFPHAIASRTSGVSSMVVDVTSGDIVRTRIRRLTANAANTDEANGGVLRAVRLDPTVTLS